MKIRYTVEGYKSYKFFHPASGMLDLGYQGYTLKQAKRTYCRAMGIDFKTATFSEI